MKLNQSDFIIKDIIVKSSYIEYKQQLHRDQVRISFLQNSLCFLSSLDLKGDPNFESLTVHYSLKEMKSSQMTFTKRIENQRYKHSDFIQLVDEYLSNFTLYRIEKKYCCSKSFQNLRNRINRLNGLIGVSREFHQQSKGINIVFVYCPQNIKQKVEAQIHKFISAVQEKLVYSLNSFIKKDINPKDYMDFIGKFGDIFCNQFISISQGVNPKKISIDLEIKKVAPIYIPHNKHPQSMWTSRENNHGIFGIQFVLEGFQYHFGKFFSLVESFLENLNFIVKKICQINCYEHDLTKFIQVHKLEAICLQNIIVIFRPPNNFHSILKQLRKKTWSLTPKLFPKLSFDLLNQHKHNYIKKLKSGQLYYSNLNIELDQISFLADQSNYERIKILTMSFMRQMMNEQTEIQFIDSPQKLQTFKKYYLDDEITIYWRNGKAFLNSFQKDISNYYNKLLQYNKIYCREKVVFLTQQYKNDPLVTYQQKYIHYQHFQRMRYKHKQCELYFCLKRYEEIYEQQNILFFVSNFDQNKLLRNILNNNEIRFKSLGSLSGTEINLRNEIRLSTLYFTFVANRNIKQNNQKSIINLIQEQIKCQKPLAFVLPSNSYQIYKELLQFLFSYITLRKRALLFKDVFIYIPTIKNKKQQDYMIDQINHAFCSKGKFQIVNRSYLSVEEILNANYLSLVKLTCVNLEKKIICSPINSFIFKNQIESAKNPSKIAVFISSKICRELLVMLHSEQIHQISRRTLRKLEGVSENIKKTIRIIKKYCTKQNYVILLQDMQKGKIPKYFYLYDKNFPSKLMKIQIKLSEQLAIIKDEWIDYEFALENKKVYQVQMHKKYLEQYWEKQQHGQKE